MREAAGAPIEVDFLLVPPAFVVHPEDAARWGPIGAKGEQFRARGRAAARALEAGGLRFIDATPEAMLARFNSLIHLAQIGPVLVATPVLGWVAHQWSVEAPILVMAGVLLATSIAVHRAETGLSPVPDRSAGRSQTRV